MKIKCASSENVAIIDSSWCINRAGVCLSFAIPIQVMSIDELKDYGKEFVKAINASHKDLITQYFYAKTDTPIVAATPQGEIIMMWSFQGDDNKETKQKLKEHNIKQINYD